MSASIEGSASAACRRVLAEKSKSFALASRLLPRSCRDEIAVVYAYCRRVDDAIDLAPKDERPRALARLREELDAVYSGDATGDATLDAFAAVVRVRGIPRRYPEELLAGMEMDVLGARYESFDELLLYCHRVAGVVGLMLCHVMGVRDRRALPNAAHLGIAMQLTNVCRDVAEDLADGRVYLPRGELGAELVPGPVDVRARREVARVVRWLLHEADRHYRSADAAMTALPLRCALAVRAARLVYAAIGDELRRRGFDPFQGRAVVPTAKKLALVLAACGRTLLEIPGRLLRSRRAPPADFAIELGAEVLALGRGERS